MFIFGWLLGIVVGIVMTMVVLWVISILLARKLRDFIVFKEGKNLIIKKSDVKILCANVLAMDRIEYLLLGKDGKFYSVFYAGRHEVTTRECSEDQAIKIYMRLRSDISKLAPYLDQEKLVAMEPKR